MKALTADESRQLAKKLRGLSPIQKADFYFFTLIEEQDPFEFLQKLDLKKHGDHDQSSHGSWAHGISVAPEVVRSTLDRVKENGGLSVNLKDGSEPTKGFMVAKGKKFAAIVKADEFFDEATGAEILSSYMKQHKTEFNNSNNYLGLWHNTEDGQVYLDVSENIQDEAEATSRGRERDQISIWDVANFKEIPTGGTGGIEKTRGGSTSRYIEDDRRRDRKLRQRDLGEVSKTLTATKVIYFEYGLKPVLKHGEHDQSEHGNWARGFTDSERERIESMKDLGPSKEELKAIINPREIDDDEIRTYVENNGDLYDAITEDIDYRVEERLAALQAEFPNHEYSEQEKATIYENVQRDLIDAYIEDNRDDLSQTIRDESGETQRSIEEITMALGEVFDIDHSGTDANGKERTFSSRTGYGDDTGGGVRVLGDILDENNNPVGEFQRTFYEKNGALLVEHDLLNIWDEENRGTGFGKEFIQRSEAWYVSKGIDAIIVGSGLEDGARHWARAGYDWRSPDHAETALNTLIATAGNRFERNSPERAEFDAIMARAFDGYTVKPEGDASMTVNYKAMKSMKEDGFPLPADFANIGYKEGAKEWAGKTLMYGQTFKYSKVLTPEGMKLLEGPIDHDGDGLIYDGTPREKPAPSGGNK